MAKLGDRVLYRAHTGHHTTIEEHIHETDPATGKKIPVFEMRMVGGEQVKVPVMRALHKGSIHHEHLRDFVAIVGRVRGEKPSEAHPSGRTVYDLLLLVPNRPVIWIDGAVEGSGDHEFTVREDAEDRALDLAPLSRRVETAHGGIATHGEMIANHAERLAVLEGQIERATPKPEVPTTKEG